LPWTFPVNRDKCRAVTLKLADEIESSVMAMTLLHPDDVRLARFAAVLGLVSIAPGCAVSGEDNEREAADGAGRIYRDPLEARELPKLPDSPSLVDVLHYGFLSNPGLERAYFEWRMALERVPQARSFDDPRFRFEHIFSRERMSRWDRTTLGASQMIPFPGKLEAAGRAALEGAVAAGRLFEDAKFGLQAEIVESYTELATTDRSIAIGRENLSLLRQFVDITRTLVGTGRARQAGLLKAELESEEAESELKSVEARRSADLARLNRLLSRSPMAPLGPRMEGGDVGLPAKDDQLFALAASRNPELAAMAAQVRGQEHALDLARKAWFPDLELSFDVRGSLEKMIGAMLTLPFQVGRIRAGIREAEAGIRAAQAALRERSDDVRARLVLQLYLARDSDRKAKLIRDAFLPKARKIVDATREAYGTGAATFLELLDAQRALLTLDLEGIRMDAMRRQASARLEALCGLDFGALPKGE
jgi:outer membrane protein, heavy metal efflux system